MKQSLFSVVLIAMVLSQFGVAQLEASDLATNGQSALQANPPQSGYTITDLGTLGGASEASAISDNGQVAGRYLVGYVQRAFLWKDGVMQDLGTLSGGHSEANGVNDDGQVVGYSLAASGHSHAFLWQNGSMQDLGTLGGILSMAWGINNSGQVAGVAINNTYQQRAFLWNGGMADLGTVSGGDYSYGQAINDAGQVAGWARLGAYPDYFFHAFLWNGSMQDLGALGWAHSMAFGINDNGAVVGRLVNQYQDDWHAFSSQGGGMQDLGGMQSTAYDINNAGLVVGAVGQQAAQRAVLWENGQMKDLNTLIPANSGWVLQSARAINNKGQIVGYGSINGQTRAFLLKPQAYYWINPAGGSWYTSSNWDPQGVPGAGDKVVFALTGQYSVDTTPIFEVSAAVGTEAGQILVESTNTVDFHSLVLNLLGDSPANPGLQVAYEGIVNIHSGSGSFVHGAIGILPPVNTINPLPARLQVFNSGTTLTGTGGLAIGVEGPGDLFIANGGHLTSAEARLGGLLATAPGTAVVGGDGSLWDTGNMAVGYGFTGILTIESGGRVNSNDASVSFGVISDDSNVTIEGVGAGTGQASMWALLGSLTVGQTGFGFVEVQNGGDLYVSQNVQIKNGSLNIEGRRPNGDPSDLDVLGSVFVGGAGSVNILALRNAAKGDIEGDLIIGKDGVGAAILWGTSVISNPTQLDVVDPQAGLCAIGREFDGGVSLDEGGMLRCQKIELGGRPGTNGSGSLTVDGGMVTVLDVLQVGQDGGGGGQLDMQNNALVATDGTYIASNGVILGTGTLTVGFLGLVNHGTLSPAITVHTVSRLQVATQSSVVAPGGLRTLTIDGDLVMQASGVLIMEYAGLNPGEFDVLHVTGQTTLGGRLEVHFRGGFSPPDPTAFIHSQDFVEADGVTTGDYDQRIYAFPDLFADFDDDGDKDLSDLASFQNCFGLSGAELELACERADWENDGAIGEREFQELAARLTGP